jgi:hypothetical protein
MIKGIQTGTLMFDGYNGIKVTIDAYSIHFQRIVNNQEDEYKGYAMYKDKYDTRQGNYVGGIVLCDANGYPNDSEHYMLSEFTWSGNISYGGGEVIPFL